MAEDTPTAAAAATTTPTAPEATAAMSTTSTSEQTNNDRLRNENQPQQQQDTKRLDELTAAAKLQYSLKNYTAAADLFSSATELQAALRGEMAVENAELLYAYGRCLYQVAVSRSDVLGGKVGEEANAAGTATEGLAIGERGEKGKRGKKRGRGDDDDDDNVLVDVYDNGKGKGRRVEEFKGEQEGGSFATAAAATSGSKTALDSLPEVEGGEKLFQFKGDENFTMPDDEEEGDYDDAEGEGEGGERDEDEDEGADEDDFANAYEILDLARILVKRQRDELAVQEEEEEREKEKESRKSPLRQLDERLADIYDLQAEISLENERFNDAVADCRAALQLKKELYPPQSNLVAEAHFKLSLALEFASVTTTTTQTTDNNTSAEVNEGNAGEGRGSKDNEKQQQQVDGKMREEAAQEMAAAIESCKLRIAEEEERKMKKKKGLLVSEADDTAEEQAMAERKEREIADVKEMVEDMEQRVCYDFFCCLCNHRLRVM